MSVDHPLQSGVTQLAVNASGEAYVAGLAGAGFPVTASAPQICFEGNANAFVAHLDPHGALVDASYAGQNVVEAFGLSLAGDGSVLLVLNNGGETKSQIRFGGAGWSAPACLSPSILNSATLSVSTSGNSVVVPGEIITLTGFGIGPDNGVAYQPNAQGQVPLQLAGVRVLFDGQPAPVLYAQSRQINAIAPVELSGQTQTNITVAYNQGNVGSIPASVMAICAPGIFRLQAGVSSQAAALNQDGTLNGPSNPAARGSAVSVWGTGFGLTDPACATGDLNPPGPVNLAAGLSVVLFAGLSPEGTTLTEPALYAGGAPTSLCGVEQINMLVPTYAQPGLYQFFPWSLMEIGGGAQSAAAGTIGVTIYVK
jgi:uncharacterized protein (TIGR03437 family)